MRKVYSICGMAAAACLVAITGLICIQVLGRILDRVLQWVGMTPLNAAIPSIAEICGFLLAAATFLALADTFSRGGHIRVTLLLEALPGNWIRPVDALATVVSLVVALAVTRALARLAWKSWTYGDVSSGLVAVPLALPQAIMALGLLMLVISLLDRLWGILRGGPAVLDDAPLTE